MLYYVMRPSSLGERCPTFTRYGVMGKSAEAAITRAKKVNGRAYATDGANKVLLADFWQEPTPEPVLAKREYWAARNQVALFVGA